VPSAIDPEKVNDRNFRIVIAGRRDDESRPDAVVDSHEGESMTSTAIPEYQCLVSAKPTG